MVSLNEGLKLVFVLCAAALLIIIVSVPKTDCEACKFEYEGKEIDGYDAYKIFEEACISYAKPWDSVALPDISDFNFTAGNTTDIYINIDDLEASEDEDGKMVITMTNESPQILTAEDIAELGWGDSKDSPHTARITE